jgi:hypothetical protein
LSYNISPTPEDIRFEFLKSFFVKSLVKKNFRDFSLLSSICITVSNLRDYAVPCSGYLGQLVNFSDNLLLSLPGSFLAVQFKLFVDRLCFFAVGAFSFLAVGYAFAYGDGSPFIGWTHFALADLPFDKFGHVIIQVYFQTEHMMEIMTQRTSSARFFYLFFSWTYPDFEAKRISIFFVFAKLFKFFPRIALSRLQQGFKIPSVAYSDDFEYALKPTDPIF